MRYRCALVLLLLGWIFPGGVFAYELGQFSTAANGDFVISPAKTELVVAPGETIVHTITVKSRIEGRQKFRISVRDFVGSQNLEEVLSFVEPEDVVGENPYALSRYVAAEMTEFELGLGEMLSFQVRISVPADAPPGGRYGAVLVSAEPQDVSRGGGAGVSFVTEIGSLLLVRVDGNLQEYGYVEDFLINGSDKGVFFNQPLTFTSLFRNEGNVHLIPYGQIVISNIFGNTVDAIPIDAYFALPDSLRLRTYDWPAEGQKKFLLGRYAAELQMYPGYRDVPEVLTVYFWYVPIWVIVSVIGVVLVGSFAYVIIQRRARRRRNISTR